MENIKIFKFKPLSRSDKIIVGIHIFAIVATWTSYNYHLIKLSFLKDFVSTYLLIFPMFLAGVFFRNLRNLNFYIIWVIFGILQLLVYPELTEMQVFDFKRGSAFSGLSRLLPTMIVYQVLRVIFIKTYNMEMIISIGWGRMTMWEEEEKRNMTWLEVLFSLTILFVAVFSGL